MANLYTRYIKIAKIDADGIDNTPSLSSLQYINIPWSDGSKVRYKVISRSQQTDFFDYLVEYEPTSSIYYPDSASFDYSFENRFAFLINQSNANQDFRRQVRIANLAAQKQIVYDITLPDNNYTDSQFPVNNFNNAGSYNISNPGVWGSERNKYVLFDTYPQKDLKIEFSGSLTIPSNQDAEFDLYCVFRDPQGNPIPPDQDTLSPNPTDGPFYVGGNFNGFTWNPNTDMLRIYGKGKRGRPIQTITNLPFYVAWTIPKGDAIPGSYLELYVQSQNEDSNGTATTTVTFAATLAGGATDTKLRIIQTEPASAVTPLQAVFEPILEYKFQGSDCDVLQNNVIKSRPNSQLQDIDYSTSQTVPVNYKALLNYTATKATYPASNFTMTSILSPEYGSENTNINGYNTGSGFNTQTSAGTFVVYYTSNKYDSAGTQPPKYINTFEIEYIFTPEQELKEAIASDETLILLQQNFQNVITGSAATAFVSSISGSLGDALDFEVPISSISAYLKGGKVFLESISDTKINDQQKNHTGIIYPNGINDTSVQDNPNKMREALSEKNII